MSKMAANNDDGKGIAPSTTSHRSQQIQLLSLLGIMLCIFTVLYIQVERQHHGHFTSSLVTESLSHWATFHNHDPTHRLPIPITLWSSDFHISPIADIKSIVSKWGVKVIDKSLSGHCHLTSTCARDLKVINQQNGISLPCANSLRRSFYDTYREDPEFRSADAFVCTHADSMCELFMPFNRPLIVVASTRYEIGRLEASHWNRWNKNLKKIITKSEWNSVGANNQYDRAYMQYFTDFTEQQLFYLPNLCQYVTARYQYPPHRNEVLLAPYRGINAVLERKLFKTLQAFREHQMDLIAQHNMTAPATSLLGRHVPLAIRKIADVYPNHYEYSELASHPAVVLLPYQVSIMSFFEFYHMNMPIFVPSPALLTKWHLNVHILHERTWMSVYEMPQHSSTIPRHPNSTCSLHGDPNDEFSAAAIEEWIKLSDFYTWPHVTTFESWEDLFAKLWMADLSAISRRMEQYNLELKERVEGEWLRILTKVAEAKRRRLAEEEAWVLQQQNQPQQISTAAQSLHENAPQHLRKSTDSMATTTSVKSTSVSSSSQAMPQMSLEGLGIDVEAELSALNEKNAAVSVSAKGPGARRDPRVLPDDINDSLQQSYGIRLVEHSCEDQMEV